VLRLPPLRFAPVTETSWAIAGLAVAGLTVAAVVLSGWLHSARPVRIATAAVVVAGTTTVVALGGGLWLVVRASAPDTEVSLVAEGTILSTSDLAASLGELEAARPGLDELNQRLEWPVWWPLRAVPVVAQQVAALDVTVDVSRDLVARAGEGAAVVDDPALRPAPGRVDLAALEALETPLETTVATLASADERLDDVDSPLLLGGLAGVVDDLRAASAATLPPTEVTLEGTRAVAGMLGADGPRAWLVQYVGVGGTEAQLAIADAGVITPSVPVDPALLTSVGDLSTSPDYPSAATEAAARLAGAGVIVNGIITVDTSAADALAAALGAPEASGSAASLVATLGATVAPSPGELAGALGAAAEERRLLVWSSVPTEEAFLERIDVAGNLRVNDGTVDLVYVGLAPQSGVGPDQLGRAITYRTDYDAGTGESSSRGELVISNRTATPLNAQLTLITGFEIDSLEVQGIRTRPTRSDLSGWGRWTLDLALPATGDLTVNWQATGTMPTFDYTFGFTPQPFANQSSVTWDFRWTVYGSEGKYVRLLDGLRTSAPLAYSPRF